MKPAALSIASRTAAVAVAVAFCLAACSRHDTPAAKPPPTPAAPAAAARIVAEPAIEAPKVEEVREAQWMRAIFGERYDAGERSALVDIEDGEDAGSWRMTLYAAKALPDGRIAVVVNGSPVEENGDDLAAHASPGMLSAYTLRPAGSAWHVVERYQDVSTRGSNGNIGIVEWMTLGPGKTGIIVSSGGTWTGQTILSADIFDLDHGMRSLGGFKAYSSNAGDCTADKKDCWDIEGKTASVPTADKDAYRDIVVDFTGKYYRVTQGKDGNDVEHTTRAVRQTARYRFDGKVYVLVSGENPVPDI